VQSILTLLTASGTLTKAGQTAGKQTLKAVKVPEPYWQELGAGVAFLLLLGLLGLRQSLPQISIWYTDRALENYHERVLELDADNATAHFWGRLYEDLQKPDEARTQYQYAIALSNRLR